MIGPDVLRELGADVAAQLACLGAAVSYAFAGIYGRRFRGEPALAVAAGQLVASTAMLAPLVLLVDRPWTLPSAERDRVGRALALAALSTALGYVIFFRILARAGATNLLLVTFLIPVSAILLGTLVLGEQLAAARHIIGMRGVIALGLAGTIRRDRRGRQYAERSLPRRHRLLAAIVVEAAIGLAAEPAGLDVFHQQRAGAVLRIRQALVQHLHHRQAGIEADEVGELQRAHRMVRAELHRGVDRLDGADALVERVDRLVDHRQQDAVDDEGREVLGDRDRLAELLDELPARIEGRCRTVAMPRISSTSSITGTGFMK